MAHLADILLKRAPVVNVLTPDQTVAEAVRLMSGRRVGCVLLVEAGALVGIFSERDLLRRVISEGTPIESVRLRHVMTQNVVTSSPDERRAKAIVKMQQSGCRHLPILVEGQVVDTVSIRDLLFDEIKEREGEIQELRRYIQGD